MLKYGYVGETEHLSNYLTFNEQLRDSYHPFSGKSFGDTFGSREYNKWLPLKDYLEMPVDVIDDILEGVAHGEIKAAKLKAEAAKRAAQQAGNASDPQTAAINNATKGR